MQIGRPIRKGEFTRRIIPVEIPKPNKKEEGTAIPVPNWPATQPVPVTPAQPGGK